MTDPNAKHAFTPSADTPNLCLVCAHHYSNANHTLSPSWPKHDFIPCSKSLHPMETCDVCGTDPRNAQHNGATQLKVPLVEEQRDDEIIDADIQAAAAEANNLLAELKAQPISSPEEKELIEEALSKLAAKGKFLDDERKISTAPLNDEVSRINDWYRPATTAIKNLIEQGKLVLSAYVLKQRKEAERLAAQAQAEAAKALAAKTTTAPAAALMTQSGVASQSVQSQKGAGVTHKPVWRFRVTDPASVPRAFLSPDENKIKEHVAKNGNVNVPAGVEVYEDVSFRISKK